MNKLKDFFINRSNWFYFKVISLVYIAGLITGMMTPQVSFKDQPLTDWIVALCTIGIFLLPLKLKTNG